MTSSMHFYGVADRVIPVDVAHPGLYQSITNLRQLVTSQIFPLDLRNLFFVIGVDRNRSMPLAFTIKARGREEKLDVSARFFADDVEKEPRQGALPPWHSLLGILPRIDGTGITMWEPGAVDLFDTTDSGNPLLFGSVEFRYERGVLSDGEAMAIRSNPLLNRWIRFILECKKCGGRISPCVGIAKPTPAEMASDILKDCVWHEDLPDAFQCPCGTLKAPLRYLRESMPVLLRGQFMLADGSMTGAPAISSSDIEQILLDFGLLIRSEADEHEVQAYIEKHPLLLAPFGAIQLFYRPPILTRWKADFGIITAQRRLVLIEIERPGMPLFKKDGDPTADFNHAIGQTRRWKDEIVQNPSAVTRCIRECPPDIAGVDYVVIAGRRTKENSEAVDRHVRTHDEPRFLTYDDLIEQVRATARAVTG